jgi:hypothetical protein
MQSPVVKAAGLCFFGYGITRRPLPPFDKLRVRKLRVKT